MNKSLLKSVKKRAKTALNNGNTAIYIFKSREKRVKSVEKSVNKPGRDDSKTEAFIRVFRIDLRSDRSLDKPRCRLAAEGPAKAEKKPGALSPSHRAFSKWPPDFSPTTKIGGQWSVDRGQTMTKSRRPKTKNFFNNREREVRLPFSERSLKCRHP